MREDYLTQFERLVRSEKYQLADQLAEYIAKQNLLTHMNRAEALKLVYRMGFVYPELVLHGILPQRNDIPQPFIDCLRMAIGEIPSSRIYRGKDMLVSVKSALYKQKDIKAKILLCLFYTSYGLIPISLVKNTELTIGGPPLIPLKKKKGGLVSVIVTTYNSETFVERCLDSLINQTWENIEIIVVDDASIDNTVQIIKEKYPQVKLVPLECNAGTYHARNVGISYAVGEYVTFQDSDDWSHPQRVEIQMNFLPRESEVCANYSSFFRINVDSGLPDARQLYPLVRLNLSSLLIKKEDILRLDGFDASQRVESDRKLFEMIRNYNGSKVEILSHPLAVGALRRNSLTTSESYGFNKYGYSPARVYY